MVFYKPIKISINASSFVEVIIDIMVKYHGLADSIVTGRGCYLY